MTTYRKSDAGYIAKAALELATTRPELVFRNPEKVEQGWKQMREDRAGFAEFFGGDELVLPPAEAEERLNAYYRHRQEAALALLRQPDFTWAEHGEAVMRRRKAWYYGREPRPGVSVNGARLLELAFGGRG